MTELLGDYCKRIERGWNRDYIHSGYPFMYARIDGKGFSKFTKKMERPFSRDLMNNLDRSALFLAEEVNAYGLYLQSDEISIFWKHTGNPNFEYYFGGKVSKINSICASIFTAHFNRTFVSANLAFFDCRVMAIDSEEMLKKILKWRQIDCWKNAINMVAMQDYSTKQLQGVTTNQKIEMLGDKAKNIDEDFLYGRFFIKKPLQVTDTCVRNKMVKVSKQEFNNMTF